MLLKMQLQNIFLRIVFLFVHKGQQRFKNTIIVKCTLHDVEILVGIFQYLQLISHS